MGLAPWARREQMAKSRQIVSVHVEQLRLVCKEKEENGKQKGRLAASRDSKRDATANPIRKTQLNLPLPGHSHADWLWQKTLMGKPINRTAEQQPLVLSMGTGWQMTFLQRGWSGGERGEDSPCDSMPKCSSPMSRTRCDTLRQSSREVKQQHTRVGCDSAELRVRRHDYIWCCTLYFTDAGLLM